VLDKVAQMIIINDISRMDFPRNWEGSIYPGVYRVAKEWCRKFEVLVLSGATPDKYVRFRT